MGKTTKVASCLALLVFLLYSNSTESCKNEWLYSSINSTSCSGALQHSIPRLSCRKLIEKFPLDQIDDNYVRTVKSCVFSKSTPTRLKGPLKLAAVSKDVLQGILDLDPSVIQTEDFLQYISGGLLFPGSEPLAHRYGGHQFGYWAGQLGDGRAHLLGEYTNRQGETWELQLKGSGRTPYSRSGDGRAVVRSSVREFLCSEAMHHLGIATSRAVSLVVSEEPVWRDQFYNGNAVKERGAVVLRLAKSWFRIGSVEILSHSGELNLLRKLLDFVIEEYYPTIKTADPDKFVVLYSAIVNETAHLIAQWMSVGFTHGVGNTDNFSLLSITIDYGPFGFMEAYNPNFVPNTSDDEGRYSIGTQANVGLYNLKKLLESLNPVLSSSQQLWAKQILQEYPKIYQRRCQELFRAKLGLEGGKRNDAEDEYIIAFLLKLMEDTSADFTMTFRQLSEVSISQLHNRSIPESMWALQALSAHELFFEWVDMYLSRLQRTGQSEIIRQHRMRGINPRYVLRNWMAESAIRKTEKNDFSEVRFLHDVLTRPYTEQRMAEERSYASRPPPWAEGLKVSCSS